MSNEIITANLSWPPCNYMLLLKKEEVEKFKCSHCKELLVNAHQADDCGCRFCSECLDKMCVFAWGFFSLKKNRFKREKIEPFWPTEPIL